MNIPELQRASTIAGRSGVLDSPVDAVIQLSSATTRKES